MASKYYYNLRGKSLNLLPVKWKIAECNSVILSFKTIFIQIFYHQPLGFPFGFAGKESICLQWGRPRFDPWVGKIPWRSKRLPTPIFWTRESHGLYSSWGCRVGHDWAPFTFTLPSIFSQIYKVPKAFYVILILNKEWTTATKY